MCKSKFKRRTCSTCSTQHAAESPRPVAWSAKEEVVLVFGRCTSHGACIERVAALRRLRAQATSVQTLRSPSPPARRHKWQRSGAPKRSPSPGAAPGWAPAVGCPWAACARSQTRRGVGGAETTADEVSDDTEALDICGTTPLPVGGTTDGCLKGLGGEHACAPIGAPDAIWMAWGRRPPAPPPLACRPPPPSTGGAIARARCCAALLRCRRRRAQPPPPTH